MNALLDTQAFLWWITDNPRLSETARDFIADGANEVFFSVVSAWEIVVKAAAGRITLPDAAPRFIPHHVLRNGFAVLPVSMEHALGVAELPPVHRDPFDRLLVAQALGEGLAVLTGDAQIERYPVRVIW
ncbi:MAG TPA: type II toxin-antitoxin system VapC family toxin [bacterium]|nr:type II toxin-antitoxin system VapC family toxin [bacterium]